MMQRFCCPGSFLGKYIIIPVIAMNHGNVIPLTHEVMERTGSKLSSHLDLTGVVVVLPDPTVTVDNTRGWCFLLSFKYSFHFAYERSRLLHVFKLLLFYLFIYRVLMFSHLSVSNV